MREKFPVWEPRAGLSALQTQERPQAESRHLRPQEDDARASRARLLPGEPFRVGYPTDDNMSVAKKTRVQRRFPAASRLRTQSQRSELSRIRISSGMKNLPSKMPSSYLHAGFFGRPTVASGLPRFVIVIVPPRLPISSSRDRHFALNSVTPIVWCFTNQFYPNGHLTTS